MPRGRSNPKAILTGEGTTAVQAEIPGFEQKRIAKIETWATKYDEKRELINGLTEELENVAFKLREAVHEHETSVDHQDDPKNGPLLVYKRGDFNVVVKRGREKVNVKIGEKSKGSAIGEDEDND